jgi:hypothetical protein
MPNSRSQARVSLKTDSLPIRRKRIGSFLLGEQKSTGNTSSIESLDMSGGKEGIPAVEFTPHSKQASYSNRSNGNGMKQPSRELATNKLS